MAKVAFSKLGLKVNQEVKTITINGQSIEIKEYLPFQEKVSLVERVVNQSVDDNGFYNPMRVKIYMHLEIIYAYTNLSFTDKMKEDMFKLYDLLMSSGIGNIIFENINAYEFTEIENNILTTINNIYNYRNSAMGILGFIAADYSNVEMDATKIQEMLTNSENLDLVKQIVTKLG